MYKHIITTFAAVTLLIPALAAKTVHISTPTSSLVMEATKGKQLKHLYYGAPLNAADVDNIKEVGYQSIDAFPAYGLADPGFQAFSVVHHNGDMTSSMVVKDVKTSKADGADITTITLQDKVYPFYIDLNFKTWPGENVMEAWSDYYHSEKGDVKLTQFSSAYLPIRMGDVWLSQFFGTHHNEMHLDVAPLPHGTHVIRNAEGIRNSQTDAAEVMLSLDGAPRENDGRVIGAALCYGGNYKLLFDTDNGDYHHFAAGINEENSAYNLAAGKHFVTPALAVTFSNEGLSGASRNFHSWGRNHRLAHPDTPRRVLLNSWEGVYLNVREDEMHQMMDDIADLGGELFVMDDGWFGRKYKRNKANAALGDWIVDTDKLPHGITGLTDAAKDKGIDFGIWVEPEMVNTASELYEAHPEYVLKPIAHDPYYGRGGTQMVLDLGNPAVQDIIFNMIDTLLTNYPDITYIKWDCNNPGRNRGSQYQTADNQSHTFIDYHNGLAAVLTRIRAKYPDVTIQDCASGGGRANWGILPWFDEYWVSDNTDALQRVYLQWTHSYFFPAIAMASHVSASPNHQTHRKVSMKYRLDVAMSGRLGVEMQPSAMTEEEKELCRNAIEQYKTIIRPVLQKGDIYRLISPYDNKQVASLMYVTPGKDEAVFYWWKTETFRKQQLPRVRMAGLDPEATYTITELNSIDTKPLKFEGKSFTGQFLMDNGLEIPFEHTLKGDDRTDWSSRVLYLKKN